MNRLPPTLLDMNDEFGSELGVPPGFGTEVPVLVVTGSNGSGKSFLRRYLCMRLRKSGVEAIHLSQQGRSDAGVFRCMVYGSEEDQSTGAISARTFVSGLRTSRGRNEPHALIWDEPEIGMSEELQAGTADWLFDRLTDWPTHLSGVILLTHSRIFVRRAMSFPDAKWLNLDGLQTPESWLGRPLVPVNPEEFASRAMDKWRRLNRLLSDHKKSGRKAEENSVAR